MTGASLRAPVRSQQQQEGPGPRSLLCEREPLYSGTFGDGAVCSKPALHLVSQAYPSYPRGLLLLIPTRQKPKLLSRKAWGCHGDQATCLPWTSLNVLVAENKPKCTDFKLLVVSPWPTQSLWLILESTGGAPK